MDPPDYSRCVLRYPQPTAKPNKNCADPTERLPNYSIIHSPSFTFLVGPRHTKLTIQSALAQHVSKPLHNLMNNGHTRESRHRIAVLEEEDVETFVAFCEYAYTGDYKVPQAPVPREHRVSVAESAHSPVNSWRGTYRSSSMSSAVPPPAPSPPPEFVDNGQSRAESDNQNQSQPEVAPTSVIGEDPVAEAAAEAATQAEAGTETGAEAETGIVEEDKPPLESVEEPMENKDDQPVQTEDAGLSPLPETDEQPESNLEPNPEPATESSDWVIADESPKENNEGKGKKGKKKDKKKKKNQLALEGEAPAHLTPPTTPPTHPVDMHELSPDNLNATEESAEAVEPVEPEPVTEQTAEIASPECSAEPNPAEPSSAEPDHAAAGGPEPEQSEPAEKDPDTVPEPATQSTTPPPERWEGWETPNNEVQKNNEGWPEAEDQQQAAEEPIDPPKPVIDMSFAKQPDASASPRTPGMSLWDEFATLQYNDEHHHHHHTNTNQVTSTSNDSPTDLPYLTFHAKVYVFATRYLIPALAQLCLRKLHRDLVQMHLTFADADVMDPYQDSAALGGLAARQAPRVLDLIRYAYTKTTRLEPISPTSATQLRENELRRLVVHYAACKVKELARYHSPGDSEVATPSLRPIDVTVRVERERAEENAYGNAPKSLRSLLDMTPELASDLVYRMM